MNHQPVTIYGMLALALLLLNAVILETAVLRDSQWYKALWLSLPLLFTLLYMHRRKRRTVLVNTNSN